MKKHVFLLCLLLSAEVVYPVDFNCAAGDVNCLIVSIQIANGNGADNTIFLDAGTYTLGVANNNTDGPNGLPSITGRITIQGFKGSGSTIQRDPNASLFRIFHVAVEGNLSLDWLGVRGGRADVGSPVAAAHGGGIFNRGNLSINRSAIFDNWSGTFRDGGGIYSVGTLTITHTDIDENVAPQGAGGGIRASGSLLIEDSFVHGNRADISGGLLVQGFSTILRTSIFRNASEFGSGGGISNSGSMLIEDSHIDENRSFGRGGGISASGVLVITSSTVSRNRTHGPLGGGGAIANSGDLFVKNATVVDNAVVEAGVAEAADGGISNQGTARLQNTILALNTRTMTPSGSIPSDCNNVYSHGNNLFGNLAGCTVALRSTDKVGEPGLGTAVEAVSEAGTRHYPLLPNSPAIDAADSGACTPRDQIHNPRQRACDIGAIEFQGTPSSGTTLNASPSSVQPGQTVTAAWSGIVSPTGTDWIGLFRQGTVNTAYVDWNYVNCSQVAGNPMASGSCAFVLSGNVGPGTYQFRLFANNGFTVLATSNDFTITPPNGGGPLTVTPTSVQPGGNVTVTWNGISQSPTDWIGMYKTGASPNEYFYWIYVSCSQTPNGIVRNSGSCQFPIPANQPPDNTYEMRFFSNNGFGQVAVSNPFTVQ
jgi:hypothetical protein